MFRYLLAFLAISIVGVCALSPAVAAPQRILVYGDSNSWGYEARTDGAPTGRYPVDQRWTGILQKLLGSSYVIVEDGLNLRTTDLDGEDWPGSIIRPDTVNGAKHLPTAIAANMPLDLVVIMLGTNDLQARYNRSPQQIAQAAAGLAQTAQRSAGSIGNAYPAPKVLLLSPVQSAAIPIAEWSKRYAGAQEKSAGLAAAFKAAADDAGIPVFDASSAIGGAVHGVDGIHLSIADHRRLAAAVAPVIRDILKP